MGKSGIFLVPLLLSMVISLTGCVQLPSDLGGRWNIRLDIQDVHDNSESGLPCEDSFLAQSNNFVFEMSELESGQDQDNHQLNGEHDGFEISANVANLRGQISMTIVSPNPPDGCFDTVMLMGQIRGIHFSGDVQGVDCKSICTWNGEFAGEIIGR